MGGLRVKRAWWARRGRSPRVRALVLMETGPSGPFAVYWSESSVSTSLLIFLFFFHFFFFSKASRGKMKSILSSSPFINLRQGFALINNRVTRGLIECHGLSKILFHVNSRPDPYPTAQILLLLFSLTTRLPSAEFHSRMRQPCGGFVTRVFMNKRAGFNANLHYFLKGVF